MAGRPVLWFDFNSPYVWLAAPPAGWPRETWSLLPLRAATVAGEHGRLEAFARAALRTFFADGRRLDAAAVTEVAGAVGLDAGAIMAAVERPDVKQRVKDHTEEALARGVAGIPTVAIGDELFWGDDRLEEAAAAAAPA